MDRQAYAAPRNMTETPLPRIENDRSNIGTPPPPLLRAPQVQCLTFAIKRQGKLLLGMCLDVEG